jgi:RiboL-PSP-HEPN
LRRPKTAAAVQFKNSANELIEGVSYYSINKALFRPLKTIYLGGVISKLYAEFENYITDSLTEKLNTISRNNVLLSELPREVRATLINSKINHDHFKNYYASLSEGKFLENIEIQYQDLVFSWDSNKMYQISVKDIIRKNSYPSVENLILVYRRIGIANIFAEVNNKMKKDSKSILQSINSIRCGFVHDSQNPDLGVIDIKKYIKELATVVMALDHVLDKYFKEYVA